MTIIVKNKDTLVFDDFIFKCCVGKNGFSNKKKEGDKCTPKGIFKIGKVYYRPDRVNKPETRLSLKKITKRMAWCDDPYNKKYNKEVLLNKYIKSEKLYRKSSSYDILIVIEYNTKKTRPFKGSAIFIHLTKNYKPTAGCIGLTKKDFLIMLKIIKKNSTINIF